MAQTSISFEMNDKLKDEMQELCEDLGMSMDEAFQIFARKMVNEQGIPFEVTEKDYPEDESREKLHKIIRIAAIAVGIATLISALVHVADLFRKERTHRFF